MITRSTLLLLFGTVLTFGMGRAPQSGAQASTETTVQAGQTSAQASANTSTSLSTSAEHGQESTSLASGTAVNAELTAPVDAKKAKAGDSVAARTTEAVKSDGKVVIPKGARLVGHVTRASARAKGDSESTLAFLFDRAIVKGGQEIPLNMTLEALAAARSDVSAADMDAEANGAASGAVTQSSMGSARGTLGGVASTAGAATGSVANTAANVGGAAGGTLDSTARATTGVAAASQGAVGGLNAAGQLTSSSRGVFGLKGLSLSTATSGSAEGSLITSRAKNIHLDSGTRLLLVSQSAASTTSK